MSRLAKVLVSVVMFAALIVVAPVAHAGTQDFTLVNQSGVEIYALYVSESANESWEEDILGENTLPDGGRINIEFHGRSHCLWDIMATDEDDNQVHWSGINLCETSVVVLRCNDDECWAEYE